MAVASRLPSIPAYAGDLQWSHPTDLQLLWISDLAVFRILDGELCRNLLCFLLRSNAQEIEA